MIARGVLLVLVSSAASLASPDERIHPRDRHLLRSASADSRQRRRAETNDVVHESAPKVDGTTVSTETTDYNDCSNPEPKFNTTEALSELSDNQVKFDYLQNYDYRIKRSCYCYGDWVDPFFLTVRDGTIVTAVNEETGKAVSPADVSLPTIVDLFQEIDTACTTPYANLAVMYNSEMGYPESVGFDINECIADEEMSYTVTDLVDMTETKGKKTNAPGQQDKPDKPAGKPKPKDLNRRNNKL